MANIFIYLGYYYILCIIFFLIEDDKNTLVPNSWLTEACAKHGGFIT